MFFLTGVSSRSSSSLTDFAGLPRLVPDLGVEVAADFVFFKGEVLPLAPATEAPSAPVTPVRKC